MNAKLTTLATTLARLCSVLFLVLAPSNLGAYAQSQSSTCIILATTIHPKVQIVAYNPWLTTVGMSLFEYESSFDPSITSEQIRLDICEASNGFVDLQIVGRIDRNEFPLMTNGLRMTESEYLQFRAEGKSYRDYYPGAVIDMNRMVEDDSLASKIKNHEIDEIWMFVSWQMSGYESMMGGPGAFWINGPTFEADSGRAFAVMGFENAVGVPDSLHSLGHRIESTLYQAYSADQDTPWARFRKNPSYPPDWLPDVPMGVGEIHYPPNTSIGYEYDNQTFVDSTAEDWLNFPNLTGQTQPVNAQAWGNTDHGYYKWWFGHLPRAEGASPRADSAPNELRQNNWWKYIFQYYQYPELVGLENVDGNSKVYLPLLKSYRPGIMYDVDVQANIKWQDTGIVIDPQDNVGINYESGQWSIWSGVDPITDGNGQQGRHEACAILPHENIGSLIGRIGDSQPFFIGNGTAFISTYAGNLFLSINDCESFQDNGGALSIQVSTSP